MSDRVAYDPANPEDMARMWPEFEAMARRAALLPWIAVEDGLPEKEGLYLVSDGGVVKIADWLSDGRWVVPEFCWSVEPSHWMPLPAPMGVKP